MGRLAEACWLESPLALRRAAVNRSQETRRVVDQFDTPEQAARYSSEFNTRRQQRSRQAILRALADLPEHAHILDLPCGTGRLMGLLVDQGFHYTGADASPHMVEAAQAKARELGASVELAVEDVMQLSYPDACFDATIVNRLFHHYTRSSTRIAALKELRRVTKGPVFVFFLNTWTVRGLLFHFRHRNDDPPERTPITLAEFRENGRAAGLELTRTFPTRGRFNKEWYARFDPA